LARVHAAADVKRSAKLETLLAMVEQMLPQGRRILIFSQFASMLALIGRELRGKQIPHACLTGATANRQASVDAFENRDVAVFLISLKAGGTGLNLTSADTVIHYDPWWNPAVQVQATDRAYRIGQKRSVFVYHLVARGSVEERMLVLQNRKKVLADSLLGDQTGGGNALTEAEVHDLFAPLEC
jgi:SNF2 family DNA or RNA helicase